MDKPQSIYISSSSVRLLVNDDKDRVIEFNPEDLQFIEALYDLISDFEAKEKEFKKRDRALQANKNVDTHGIPQNMKARIKLNRDLCSYMRTKIDELFGEGTSQAAFGKANVSDMFAQFFTGITPFIEVARNKKIKSYVSDEADAGVMQ